MLSWEEILREVSHGEIFLLATTLVVVFAIATAAEEALETDIIKTSGGNLKITFTGHGTLVFTFSGRSLHAAISSLQSLIFRLTIFG